MEFVRERRQSCKSLLLLLRAIHKGCNIISMQDTHGQCLVKRDGISTVWRTYRIELSTDPVRPHDICDLVSYKRAASCSNSNKKGNMLLNCHVVVNCWLVLCGHVLIVQERLLKECRIITQIVWTCWCEAVGGMLMVVCEPGHTHESQCTALDLADFTLCLCVILGYHYIQH